MSTTSKALIGMAALTLVACAGEQEPARRRIADIEATVAVCAPEAAVYAPGQLTEVQQRLVRLKAAFAHRDYEAVVSDAPAVMGAAHALAGSAATAKAQRARELEAAWAALASSVPNETSAIRHRIELLTRNRHPQLSTGIDARAAAADLSVATSLWSKAQGAFAAGNLEQAVGTAMTVKTRLETLAASMTLALPEAARLQPSLTAA